MVVEWQGLIKCHPCTIKPVVLVMDCLGEWAFLNQNHNRHSSGIHLTFTWHLLSRNSATAAGPRVPPPGAATAATAAGARVPPPGAPGQAVPGQDTAGIMAGVEAGGTGGQVCGGAGSGGTY